MSSVKKIQDWQSIIEYSPAGPSHHVLADTDTYRAVLVGLEAGGEIPPHPSTDATYHFLEGSGWMIVDGERHPVSAGATVAVPAGAKRGVEADTRLAFLGSHGGRGAKIAHSHQEAAQPNRRPMAVLGIMGVFMLVLMVGLWRVAAGPMAMMLTGFGSLGLGAWGPMLLPMLGLLGMAVMMVYMFRTMSGMNGGRVLHNHGAMRVRGQKEQAMEETQAKAKQEVTFGIPSISCAGCKETIESGVAKLEGVSSVRVDLRKREAVVGYDDPATKEGIERFLSDIGYPAKSV